MGKCECCGKEVDIKTTLYKRKHKGKIYCFCSRECKLKFMKKHGIVDMI